MERKFGANARALLVTCLVVALVLSSEQFEPSGSALHSLKPRDIPVISDYHPSDDEVFQLQPSQAVGVHRVLRGPKGERREADLRDPLDRRMIAELVDAVSSAPRVNPEGADSPDVRARLSYLQIELADGRSVVIRSALHCETNGQFTSCGTIPGAQAILGPDRGRQSVVQSNALEQFIQRDDWPQGSS